MSRRSPTAACESDRMFPVRIKVRVPPTGFGSLITEIDIWLLNYIGQGNFGKRPATALGTDAVSYHFRSLVDAQRFLDAFPQLELATARPTPPPLPRT